MLVELFSQVGVDCGLLWTSDYTGIREKVNEQRRIDRYPVQSLKKTAEILGSEIKNKEIIHGLLMRSLFVLCLEDKGAAKEAGLYSRIKQDAGRTWLSNTVNCKTENLKQSNQLVESKIFRLFFKVFCQFFLFELFEITKSVRMEKIQGLT
jgi:hypothetical protein